MKTVRTSRLLWVRFTPVGAYVLLVLQREQRNRARYWELPGGRAHVQESIDKALRREVFEETGLELPDQADPHFRGTYRLKIDSDIAYKEHVTLFAEIATLDACSDLVYTTPEIECVRWFPISSLPLKKSHPRSLTAELRYHAKRQLLLVLGEHKRLFADAGCAGELSYCLRSIYPELT